MVLLTGCFGTRTVGGHPSPDRAKQATLEIRDGLRVPFGLYFVISGPAGRFTISQQDIPRLRGSEWGPPPEFFHLAWTPDSRYVGVALKHHLGGLYVIGIDSDSGRLADPSVIRPALSQSIRSEYGEYFQDPNPPDPLKWFDTEAAKLAYRRKQPEPSAR